MEAALCKPLLRLNTYEYPPAQKKLMAILFYETLGKLETIFKYAEIGTYGSIFQKLLCYKKSSTYTFDIVLNV